MKTERRNRSNEQKIGRRNEEMTKSLDLIAPLSLNEMILFDGKNCVHV